MTKAVNKTDTVNENITMLRADLYNIARLSESIDFREQSTIKPLITEKKILEKKRNWDDKAFQFLANTIPRQIPAAKKLKFDRWSA